MPDGNATRVDKAVVLARGLGTRMRAADGTTSLTPEQAIAADAGMKGMIRIGRPFLDYVLSALADTGCRRVCLVIGPEHEQVRNYYTQTSPPHRLQVEFAIQPEPLGTAYAVLAAEQFAGANEFLVVNSDNYYSVPALKAAVSLGEPGAVLFEPDGLLRGGNISRERLAAFGFCPVDIHGYISDVIEKPDPVTLAKLGHALISMSLWRFSPAIFPACREAELSPRGEYELPQAIRAAIHKGRLRLKAVAFDGPVLDLSSRADVSSVAERLREIVPNP